MTRQINTGQGDVETVTTTVTSTSDLSAATFMVAFGSYTAPGAWRAPDSVTVAPGGLSAALSFIVGNGHYNPVAGTYWIWRQIVGGDVSLDKNTRYVIDTDTGYPIGTATALITVGEVA